MNRSTLKRIAWYSGALLCVVVGYLSLSGALQMVWRSAFTHANVEQLRFWFSGYIGLLLVAIVGVVVCLRRAFRIGAEQGSAPPLP